MQAVPPRTAAGPSQRRDPGSPGVWPAGHFGVHQEHLLFPMAGFRTRFPAVTPRGRDLLAERLMISTMFRSALNSRSLADLNPVARPSLSPQGRRSPAARDAWPSRPGGAGTTIAHMSGFGPKPNLRDRPVVMSRSGNGGIQGLRHGAGSSYARRNWLVSAYQGGGTITALGEALFSEVLW